MSDKNTTRLDDVALEVGAFVAIMLGHFWTFGVLTVLLIVIKVSRKEAE